MARITVKVEPLHADGTTCDHAVSPSGKPRDSDSGCAGRRSYRVWCSSCGQVGKPHGLRVLAEPEQARHRAQHQVATTR